MPQRGKRCQAKNWGLSRACRSDEATSILINTGPGALEDREALLDGLFTLPNVVLTPLIENRTKEVIRGVLHRAVQNSENSLKGFPTDAVVQPTVSSSPRRERTQVKGLADGTDDEPDPEKP